MFGIALDPDGQRERFILVDGVSRLDINDTVFALRERPRLSNTIVSGSRACSMVIWLWMSISFRTATEVLIETMSGIASPSACGHAITRTVTIRSMTMASNWTASVHATAVTTAAPDPAPDLRYGLSTLSAPRILPDLPPSVRKSVSALLHVDRPVSQTERADLADVSTRSIRNHRDLLETVSLLGNKLFL